VKVVRDNDTRAYMDDHNPRMTQGWNDRGSIDAKIKATFGRVLEDWELAALVGAPDGATVRVMHDLNSSNGFWLVTDHPSYKSPQYRDVYRDGDGALVIGNRYFVVRDDQQGTGLGGRVIAHEVAMARRLGVDYIKAYAELGLSANGKTTFIGAKTWPRMGFNFRYPDGEWLLSRIERNGGFHWWKRHAEPNDMFFILKDDSDSMRQHDRYLYEREIAVDPDTYREAQESRSSEGKRVGQGT
jgi:GNAT superfamily N-acetyltransferase